jgi:hypothetical protein
MVKPVFLLGAAALAAVSVVADARPRHREQDAAFEARQDGRLMPFAAIRSRIAPRMRGAEYMGSELDPGSGLYRLKFMREGQVIWVDVDGRTGRVVGRSGR